MLYEVYSHCVKYSYRSSVWSKATYVILLITLLMFVIPFLVAHQTEGLWLKSDTYQEQPVVRFKYQYLFLMETENPEKSVTCTTFPSLIHLLPLIDVCPSIKVREDDTNMDGRNDVLQFEIESYIPKGTSTVKGISLLLLFDYQLTSKIWLQMESMGWVEASTSIPSSEYHLKAELRLHQKEALRNKGRDNRFNISIVPQDEFYLPSILKEYSARNVSTRLENGYGFWTRGIGEGESFKVSTTILYPEDTVLYKPGFWHILKFAWAQYLSLLVPSILIVRQIKEFILDNRLIHCIKDIPWKKDQ